MGLSHLERRALICSPNTAPAILPRTKCNYHTDCLYWDSQSHYCSVAFIFYSELQLRKIQEDNMSLTLRIMKSHSVLTLNIQGQFVSAQQLSGRSAQVCVLLFHLGTCTCFGLRLKEKQVVYVSQLHFIFTRAGRIRSFTLLTTLTELSIWPTLNEDGLTYWYNAKLTTTMTWFQVPSHLLTIWFGKLYEIYQKQKIALLFYTVFFFFWFFIFHSFFHFKISFPLKFKTFRNCCNAALIVHI